MGGLAIDWRPSWIPNHGKRPEMMGVKGKSIIPSLAWEGNGCVRFMSLITGVPQSESFFFFFFERHNGNGQPPKLVPQCTAQSVEVTATKRLHQGSIGTYWLWGYPTIKICSGIECPTLQGEIHLQRLPCGAFYIKDTRKYCGTRLTRNTH